MNIYDITNPKDRESAARELARFEKLVKKTEAELQKLLAWQMKYCREIITNKNGYEDKVMVFGSTERFIERMEKPSPVQLNEVYDIENDIKRVRQEGYEIVGGLGGFSFNNGRNAGELVFLPGGTPVRTQLENNSHYSMMVAPMNIYPLCVFTARKIIEQNRNRMIVVIFEKGESINAAMEKIAAMIGDKKKTITGVISGAFASLKGYVFTAASPSTVLTNFDLKENKNMFLYQNMLGSTVSGFKRVIHTHGYEAAKFGEPQSFGAHIDDALVNVFAIGVFAVADKVEQR